MGDIFEEIINMKAIANAEVKADIDGIINTIDGLKLNLESAKTKEQLDTALNNQANYSKIANKYKKTKIYSDTSRNYADNKKAEYNVYENGIKAGIEYITDADYMDNADEWVDMHSLAKKKGYTNIMDFIKFEIDNIESILYKMATSTEKGPQKHSYRYDKGAINDMDVFRKLNKYHRGLTMAMNGVVLDNILSREEALYAYQANPQQWRDFKGRQIKIAVDGINSTQNNMMRVDKWIADAADDGFWSIMGDPSVMSQNDMDTLGLNYQTNENGQVVSTLETEESFIDKLKSYKDMYSGQRDTFLNLYQAYEGIPYASTSSQLPQDHEDLPEVDAYTPISEEMANQTVGSDVIDADEDGIPDTIDIDGGTGTDKSLVKEAPPRPQGSFTVENWGVTLHPEVANDFTKWFNEDGDSWAGVRWQPGKSKERMYYKDAKDFILAKSNQFKERDNILDGSDKAASSMNKFLKGELNMSQAFKAGKHSPSDAKFHFQVRTNVVGKKARKKLKAFQIKFKNSGLNIQEFISQNSEEYYKMTLLLKYGDYWIKNIKPIISGGIASDRSNIAFYKDLYRESDIDIAEAEPESEEPKSEEPKSEEPESKGIDWTGITTMEAQLEKRQQKKADELGISLEEYRLKLGRGEL